MCALLSHVLKSAGIQGWHRPAETVGLSPGAAPPPFFSLISTRRGSPISRKKVLFFSYSSSSITLTDIVLLQQRRIEIDEKEEEGRQGTQRRGKQREPVALLDIQQLRHFCSVFSLQEWKYSSERLDRLHSAKHSCLGSYNYFGSSIALNSNRFIIIIIRQKSRVTWSTLIRKEKHIIW